MHDKSRQDLCHRGSGRVELTTTLGALGVVPAPHHVQCLVTEGTTCGPFRSALGTLIEQQLRPSERLASLLKIEYEATRRVRANQKVFHFGQGSFERGCWL